jgi:hypothetical protein
MILSLPRFGDVAAGFGGQIARRRMFARDIAYSVRVGTARAGEMGGYDVTDAGAVRFAP